MGLDCSHDAWHGAYSAFHRWRCEIAKVLGLPPLELMQGFYKPGPYGTLHFGQRGTDELYLSKLQQMEESLPIKWDCLKPDPIHELLYHSDCDGELSAKSCKKIARRLESILPLFPEGDAGGHIGNWKEKTQQFIDGLWRAVESNEPLDFH